MKCLRYAAATLEDTRALADLLAPLLGRGDVLLLDGPLGSGKTAFVQALASALRYRGPVTSPTFTIANFYASDSLTLLHIDAYRLDSIAEFRDLGLTDYAGDCCTVIEWGEKVTEEFTTYLEVQVTFGDDSEEAREFVLSGAGPRWAPVLQTMRRGHLRLVAEP